MKLILSFELCNSKIMWNLFSLPNYTIQESCEFFFSFWLLEINIFSNKITYANQSHINTSTPIFKTQLRLIDGGIDGRSEGKKHGRRMQGKENSEKKLERCKREGIRKVERRMQEQQIADMQARTNWRCRLISWRCRKKA